jgi:nitrite reductase/ring-hydroxylating ferredoxin subunit
MKKLTLFRTDELPVGEVRRVEFSPDLSLAVYHIDSGFYVTEDRCSHGAASLSDGSIDGQLIECPLHLGTFDIVTGNAVDAPCIIPVKTYQTEIDSKGFLNVLVD